MKVHTKVRNHGEGPYYDKQDLTPRKVDLLWDANVIIISLGMGNYKILRAFSVIVKSSLRFKL